MNFEKQIRILLIVCIFLTGLSIFFGMADKVGLCLVDSIYYDTDCMTLYTEIIAQPIFFFSISIFLTGLSLLFVCEETYLAWRKFAIFAIPIGVIILIFTPVDDGGGFFISGPDFTKETASWGVSIVFLLISLIIIVRKSISLKH